MERVTAENPSTTPDDAHLHPRRHRRALRAALTLAGAGAAVWVVGLVSVFMATSSGLLVALTVVGVTMMLLSPVWYFSYMEGLEPERYQHATGTGSGEGAEGQGGPRP